MPRNLRPLEQGGDLYDEDKVVALIERLARAGVAQPESMSVEEIVNITKCITMIAA